jgi:MerR family transcriptional regulator/heat shock protein HspR
MENVTGVYVMQVASMLTGMHPQTLRKYERAGFLAPSRSKALRMYSDEDIARLKTIKYLVDEVGLNLAGVSLALQLRDTLLDVKQELTSSNISSRLKKQLAGPFDKTLKILGTD